MYPGIYYYGYPGEPSGAYYARRRNIEEYERGRADAERETKKRMEEILAPPVLPVFKFNDDSCLPKKRKEESDLPLKIIEPIDIFPKRKKSSSVYYEKGYKEEPVFWINADH